MSYKQILTTNDIGTGANQVATGNHNHDSLYPKKDGTGARGTWGINITGSSASCTGNAATATNADKLDGYHRAGLYSSPGEWINANGYTKTITVNGDANTYYPVVITTTDDKRAINYISIYKNLGSKTASYSGNHSNGTSSMWLVYEGRNWYWDGNGGYLKCWYYSMPYATLCAETDIAGNGVGSLVVYLRGGGTDYQVSTTYNASVNVYLKATNLGSSTYPVNVAPTTSLGNLGQISTTLLGYGSISGNATTATKLATARTISLTGSVTGSGTFDGSGNLSIATTTNHNHNSSYVKKSGDTMTGMLQFSGIPTGNFTEGIRINKATDGWTSICLGGTASSGCSAETWSIHTQQDGASANFWLTHNGSNGSTDSTGCLVGANNGVWTLSNLLQIVNPNTNINGGSSQVAVIKGDNTTSSLTLYYNRDGNRGLWDSSTQKSLIYLDPNNIAASNFRWHFTGQDNSLHNLNGNYQANLSDRPFASALEIRENGFVGNSQSDIGYAPSIGFHWGGYCAGTLCLRNDAVLQWYNQGGLGTFQAGAVWGAVWNDYAEFRKAESIEPGRCVIEHSSAEMKLSTERLQPGAEIISDTFGFAIGETDECKTPIASSGRVLAYPYEDRNSYPLGAAVCSGPNGTISLMTREEIKEYPERIIGTVSEIPDYEEWGTGKVKVNGRIWIRIR